MKEVIGHSCWGTRQWCGVRLGGCSAWGTGIWLVDFEGMCLGLWGSTLGFARRFGLRMHVGFGVLCGWGLVTLKRSCCRGQMCSLDLWYHLPWALMR